MTDGGNADEDRVRIRSLKPGDLGWVAMAHGEIYASEYGWDTGIEALAARLLADFHDDFKPGREQAWIAEVDGERAGSVFCCERDVDTAQLRMLIVAPSARGLGLGKRLVGECVEFARSAGYGSIVLWTNDVLESARRIYESFGFVLVEQDQHRSFGADLHGQTWRLSLVGVAG